jgi:hypothetical protein
MRNILVARGAAADAELAARAPPRTAEPGSEGANLRPAAGGGGPAFC